MKRVMAIEVAYENGMSGFNHGIYYTGRNC